MTHETDPASSPEQQIKDFVASEPRIRLLAMALDDERLKYHLFLTGRLSAEDAGDGCSYGPKGTPRITQDIARRMGLFIKNLDDDTAPGDKEN